MQEQTGGSPAGDGYTAAAIVALLVLTGTMVLAMFTRTEPHPPLVVEPFALGPFLAASLAIGAAAFGLVVRGMRFAMAIALLFALTALVLRAAEICRSGVPQNLARSDRGPGRDSGHLVAGHLSSDPANAFGRRAGSPVKPPALLRRFRRIDPSG